MRARFGRGLLLTSLVMAVAGCGPGHPAIETPAPEGSSLPHLTQDNRGRPMLSWVDPRPNGRYALVYAIREESGWAEPVTVAEGAGWFLNWADTPSVQPLGDELWAAHWLVKQPGGMYAYDIALSLSRDGGRTWDQPFSPHQDGTPTEHGFVSLWPTRLPSGRAAAGVLWLDGRNTLLDPSRPGDDDPRTMLRGAVFDGAGEVVENAEVDGRVCDCCQTDVALTPSGPMVAYRNRSDGEVRDIHAAVRGRDGWHELGPVAEDNWVIEGCPVNGPAIGASGDTVAVAWYSEASGKGRVQLVRRPGPEEPWSRSVVIDDGTPLGRVDVAILPGGDAAVSWLARGKGSSAWIMLARVGAGGAGQALEVASTDASRPAGFPRMIRDGDTLLLAWTRWRDGASRVVTRRLPVSALPPPP